MRPAAWIVALTLAVAPAASAAALAKTSAVAAARPSESRIDVERVVSPGGVEAWLVSEATVPMIVMRATFDGGATLDPPDQAGRAGFMAAMLTEGAGELDAEAFKTRLEELNMGLSFSAGWDGIGLSLTTLSQNRDAAFDMARLALMQPRFDEAPLARLKRQSEVGIRMRETNPNWVANLALDTAMIPSHPYGARTTLEGVRSIDADDLRAAHRLHLARDRLKITVVGDIDAKTLGPLLDHVFGGLPQNGPAPPTPAVEPATGAAQVLVRTLPQPQSLVLFAAPGIQDEDPDWLPLAVANYILGGGGFSSRLMDEVREKRGLVYGVGTGPRVLENAAWLRGSAQTENEDVPAALATIKAEMRRLARQGATEAEVEDAKRYLTGSFALDLDSNVKIAGVLHAYQVDGRDIDYVNRRNALISAVTKADVDRVAARLFEPERFTFVVVGQPATLAASAP